MDPRDLDTWLMLDEQAASEARMTQARAHLKQQMTGGF